MTAPRTRPIAAIVLAVTALVMALPTGGAAQTTGSLWATWREVGNRADKVGVTACPTTEADLFSCLASFANGFSGRNGQTSPAVTAIATDGVAVTMATAAAGGLRCPIAGLGTGCSRVMTGPWPAGIDCTNPSAICTASLAAAGGKLWIGQTDGRIYRCPGDLPYVAQVSAPSACVLLDDAKVRPVSALLVSGDVLWAGLGKGCSGFLCRPSGILWRCDAATQGRCTAVRSFPEHGVTALAAGAGSLWAGLDDGRVLRCDPSGTNGCSTWKTLGSAQVRSLSYDAAGTLYAGTRSGIWSCPADATGACAKVNEAATEVSAATGTAYSSGRDLLFLAGITIYNGADPDRSYSATDTYGNPLLYIPADGPVGLGAINLQVRFPEVAKRLAARCADGVPLRAQLRVTGPHGYRRSHAVDLCRVRNPRMPKVRIALLDAGSYTVRLATARLWAERTVVVTEDMTRRLKLLLARW